jgi:pentatricopeptide repeat protein
MAARLLCVEGRYEKALALVAEMRTLALKIDIFY